MYLVFDIMSGLPSDVAHFLSCGADKVLLKPLDILAFGEAMRDVRMQQHDQEQGQEQGQGQTLEL
jgi:hypothetical protein